MKKTVLTFGLLAGAILSVMMALTMPFHEKIGFETGMLLGYASMVAAFLLIYFGIRAYRDNVAGGRVSFGRAFAIGALITLVASVCYVVTWEVIYFNFLPDFVEKYQAHAMDRARAGGASEAELAKQQAEMALFAERYRNPFFVAAYTLLEPLPVALLITLISAVVLSRKRAEQPEPLTAARA